MFDDEMLTIEEVATYLKLKPQTIYKWVQTGRIPGAKFGKEWRFRRSAIEEWIDNQIESQRDATSDGPSAASKSAVGTSTVGASTDGTSTDGSGRLTRSDEFAASGAPKADAKKQRSKKPSAKKDDLGPAAN